jgi:putative OPT family oligopeptide transporter
MKEHRGLRPEAYEEVHGDLYEPYISSEAQVGEFSVKGIILGSLIGIAFGAANAYLGLRVGLTISTSIPIAVMTVAIFAMLSRYIGRASILESNMAKTIGSCSSSLASGIIFTIPALFIWGFLTPETVNWINLVQIGTLAALGGCLGVMVMVPLRRFLIVEDHGKLPYPEGTASAEVLVAAEEGGATARNVFTGMGVGLLFSFFWKGLMLWGEKIRWNVPFINKAEVSLEPSPALLGVGYILGFKISTIMVLGAALSSLIICPVIAGFWGNAIIAPADKPVSELSMIDMRNFFIRYIGAGAVAAAGIITLIRTIPTMIKSFKLGLARLRKSADGVEEKRTDRDLSIKTVLWWALATIVVLTAVPFLFNDVAADPQGYLLRVGLSILVVIFSFFFVTVSARIVGLVGVTSNPTSGMIIGTLICFCLIFLAAGWVDDAGKATVLVMGTVVGVAASMAGDMSQELKSGFLLGATPAKQQIGGLIGVITSTYFVAASVFLLAKFYPFGTEGGLEAPQAKMMQLLIDGILDQKIPWVLVGVGVAITVVIWMLRLPTLAFAVGVYLSLSTMFPIFIGGLIRLIVERRHRADKELLRERREAGVLFGSGLVGGEGLMGVGIAGYAFFFGKPSPMAPEYLKWLDIYPQHLINILPFALLVLLLWRAIYKKREQVA